MKKNEFNSELLNDLFYIEPSPISDLEKLLADGINHYNFDTSNPSQQSANNLADGAASERTINEADEG